jgi:hypothetical protein
VIQNWFQKTETQPMKSPVDWHKTPFDVTHRGEFRLLQQHTPQNPSDWRGGMVFDPNNNY